jgi:hypothetical protein
VRERGNGGGADPSGAGGEAARCAPRCGGPTGIPPVSTNACCPPRLPDRHPGSRSERQSRRIRGSFGNSDCIDDAPRMVPLVLIRASTRCTAPRAWRRQPNLRQAATLRGNRAQVGKRSTKRPRESRRGAEPPANGRPSGSPGAVGDAVRSVPRCVAPSRPGLRTGTTVPGQQEIAGTPNSSGSSAGGWMDCRPRLQDDSGECRVRTSVAILRGPAPAQARCRPVSFGVEEGTTEIGAPRFRGKPRSGPEPGRSGMSSGRGSPRALCGGRGRIRAFRPGRLLVRASFRVLRCVKARPDLLACQWGRNAEKRGEPRPEAGCNMPATLSLEQTVEVLGKHEGGT